MQQVVNHWMVHNSFTIGVGDTVADLSTLENIAKEIVAVRHTLSTEIRLYHIVNTRYHR